MAILKAGVDDDLEYAGNLGDCVTAANCLKAIPYELVDQALSRTIRTERRLGKLPDHLVVYQIIFMAFFMDCSYSHVFEVLRKAFAWLTDTGVAVPEVSTPGITKARQRLGAEPMCELFKLVAKPLGTTETKGVFFEDLRLVAIDGSVFDVPDTKGNAGFRKQENGAGKAAFPQVRAVAMIEIATRLVVDVEFGPSAGSNELPLAKAIFSRMSSGTLCLADRLYPGTDVCRLVIKSGSHFLFRAKAGNALKLTPIEWLADGSFMANLAPDREDSTVVRVIEYTLDGKDTIYRLITSLTNCKKYPAKALAELYSRRWTIETFYTEIKQTLRAPKLILRSQSQDGVYQELYGLFLAHYVIRSFMYEAAEASGLPPDNLSFKHAVQVLKVELPSNGNFFP